MLRRLFLGLVIGLVAGVAVAAGLLKGLGMVTFAAPIAAYLLAAGTGMLTGLVAGKPIWSADGKIEAGLKAFFGAVLAAGAMFALRKWGNVSVDLSAISAGQGAIGDLPAAALPIVGGALGALFELDNTDSKEAAPPAKAARANTTRVAERAGKVRVAVDEDDELDDVPAPVAKKKR